VEIAATTGRWASEEEGRVHARSAAVRVFKRRRRAEGWPGFARALARTGAGDGYDNTALKKIIRANASGLMRFKKHSSIADGPVLLFTHKSSYIIDNLHQSLYYLTIF